MSPHMWLNQLYLAVIQTLILLYITMYLAHICDNFLFMLTFLSRYSSIYIWPRPHKHSLAAAGGTTVQTQPPASTTGQN